MVKLGLGAGSRLRKSHIDRNIRMYVSECACGGNARSNSVSQGNRGSGSISLSTVLQPTHTHTHTRDLPCLQSPCATVTYVFVSVWACVCVCEADTGCKADIYMRRCTCDKADVCVIVCETEAWGHAHQRRNIDLHNAIPSMAQPGRTK